MTRWCLCICQVILVASNGIRVCKRIQFSEEVEPGRHFLLLVLSIDTSTHLLYITNMQRAQIYIYINKNKPQSATKICCAGFSMHKVPPSSAVTGAPGNEQNLLHTFRM